MCEARRRRTQQERSADTSERLLRATIDLLYERGFYRMSAAEIADRADVSRGALNHHVTSKDDIVISAIRHQLQASTARLHEMARTIRRGPRESRGPGRLSRRAALMLLDASDLVGGYVSAGPIAKGVTLRADVGEIVTIIGPNGAGESTALKLVSGLLKPSGRAPSGSPGGPRRALARARLRAAGAQRLRAQRLRLAHRRRTVLLGRPDDAAGHPVSHPPTCGVTPR